MPSNINARRIPYGLAVIAGLCMLYACSLALAANSDMPELRPDILELRHGDERIDLPVETLREKADVTFRLHDPYRGEEVEIRGLRFRDVLETHFGTVPKSLRFVAWDDYDTTLSGWDDPNWILVTHENGEPLTLRQRGPVRLVERDYGNRDPLNLRNFNDWIWMIRRIEAVP